MDKAITFTHKKKKYKVSSLAYDCTHIVLPDGTVLGQLIWVETHPPQLESYEEIDHLFKDMPVVEIADLMGEACIAEPM